MLKALGADVASMTTWSTVDTELNSEVAEVANRTPRVHKLPYYLPIYESVVDRTRPIRMLEIGSFYEDSLQTWQEYLCPESLIVGVDVDSKFVKVADSDGIRVRIAVGQNVHLLSEVAAEFGPFDVIFDAGSQTSYQVVDSFRCLFEGALNDNGIYLVEDVHCDYWTLFNSFSFSDCVRALVDTMHGHYRIATSVSKFRTGHLVAVRRTTGI